jgi:hypothetical protein
MFELKINGFVNDNGEFDDISFCIDSPHSTIDLVYDDVLIARFEPDSFISLAKAIEDYYIRKNKKIEENGK